MGTARRPAKLKRGYDSSVDRKILDALLHELEGIIRVFAKHEPVLSGKLVTLRRRCGKPGCRCRRGKPHETRVFLARRDGRRVTRKLLWKEEHHLRKPVKRNALLVRLRGRLTKLFEEALRASDRLKAFREAEGKRIYLSRGP